MVNIGEDILKCDMAEYYHVHVIDWYAPPLPPSYLADLAAGLNDDSRIKRKIAKVRLTLNETLQALIVDKLSVLIWQKTKDGAKGRNFPDSIYKKLAGLEEKEDLMSFKTAEDFDKWHKTKMR